jgi:hypothetical protein
MPYQLGQPWTPVYKDNPLLRAAVEAQSRDNTRAMMTRQRSQGSLAAPKKTLGSVLHNALSGAVEPVLGKRMGQKLADLIDYTPVAAATEADEAGQAARSGNYLGAAGHGLGALLSALPDGGALAAKAGGALASKGAILHSIIAPLFHGSPHKFDKFALEKIGTGEGAQAYGHGLYFAENPAVATDYRQKLAGYGHTYSIDGHDFGKINDLPTAREAYAKLAPDLSPLAAVDERAPAFFHQFAPVSLGSVVRDIDYTSHKSLPEILADQANGYRAAAEKKADPRDKIAELGKAILADTMSQKTTMGKAGHLYEVKLDANPEDFLDWDAPLAQQPRGVLEGMAKAGTWPTATAEDLAGLGVSGQHAYQRMIAEKLGGPVLPGGGVRGYDAEASARLREAGIPGLRYLDQGSRAAGHGSRNYVVFDPSIIDITGRY